MKTSKKNYRLPCILEDYLNIKCLSSRNATYVAVLCAMSCITVLYTRTFTEIHSIGSRFLTIGESEKALLKADIEADVLQYNLRQHVPT